MKNTIPDFGKYPDGLVPAIAQDQITGAVLMLGFMNGEAYEKTRSEGKATFFSRSKKRLWTKGEESGNFLHVKEIKLDCDNDTILLKVFPGGPVCHNGTDTCWGEQNKGNFLFGMEQVIHNRRTADPASSYTAGLFAEGINKIAQKVGEEAVELVIEAKDNNKELFLNEAADLLFHYTILLAAKGHTLNDVIGVLESRHRK
jgi:phosphoribosyl-AMP cyclohydrolase / phosphoribosyl-ATP pyrophosphohydrolase